MDPSRLPAGTRVCVVEDDPIFRRTLVSFLGGEGLAVQDFSSAEDYLARRPAEPPHCLVLDLEMPGLSGLELQRVLAGSGPAAPVVFVSGAGDVPTSVAAMRQGAVDFIQKPFPRQALLDAMASAVARSARLASDREELAGLEARLAALSPRERQVADLVVQGLLNKQVAGALGTTESTVKVHRTRLMEKLGLESLPELVRLLDRVRVLRAPRDER
jgi:FixJ family two-component response regulator